MSPETLGSLNQSCGVIRLQHGLTDRQQLMEWSPFVGDLKRRKRLV
jgi:hypothetical protein